MGGHSHWATIKRHKSAVDAKRGKVFTRIIRELTIAARSGGDPDGNPRLRLAIAKAKEANMPGDTMKKAIQRGTGELPGVTYEEFTLEGYGPGGTAVLMEITSDNRNRTVAEIRSLLTKNGGNMAEAGAVAWQFHKKGVLVVEKGKVEEDALLFERSFLSYGDRIHLLRAGYVSVMTLVSAACAGKWIASTWRIRSAGIAPPAAVSTRIASPTPSSVWSSA